MLWVIVRGLHGYPHPRMIRGYPPDFSKGGCKIWKWSSADTDADGRFKLADVSGCYYFLQITADIRRFLNFIIIFIPKNKINDFIQRRTKKLNLFYLTKLSATNKLPFSINYPSYKLSILTSNWTVFWFEHLKMLSCDLFLSRQSIWFFPLCY